MDDYLSKPFTQEQLQQTLLRWLETPNQGDQIGASTIVQSPAPGLVDSERDGLAPLPHPFTPDEEKAAASLDQKTLDGLRALKRPGQPDLLTRTVALFLDTSADCMYRLREAVRTKDVATVVHLAHQLKSSSGIVGALGLSNLFKELELAGRAADIERTRTLLPAIESTYRVSCGALRHLLPDAAA